MVRDMRVKEKRYELNFSGTKTGEFYSQAINGEILAIDWNFGLAGSIWIETSGTGERFLEVEAAVSGTNRSFRYPRVYEQDNAGATATGSPTTPYVVNGPIALGVSGAASGTQVFDLTVRYR